MPNQNSYHDDKTQRKAIRALNKAGITDIEKALDILDQFTDAGLLIREPARKDATSE